MTAVRFDVIEGVGSATTTMRRSAIALGAAGAVFLVMLVALFLRIPTISTDILSRQEAERVAVLEAGPLRPGTSIDVIDDGEHRATVERRWFGLLESRSELRRLKGGWRVESGPEDGPGEAIQVILGLGAPTLIAFVVVLLATRRTARAGGEVKRSASGALR